MIDISVIIPTYRRCGRLRQTLLRLQSLVPPAGQIIVHVDGGDNESADMLAAEFTSVRVIMSGENLGPGGGRTRAAEASGSEWIVSFDDDSYPINDDFFKLARKAIEECGDAVLIACRIIHPDDPLLESDTATDYSVGFTGCGVLFRRVPFLEVGGYVPLPRAYGMEEVDLTLRLLEAGYSLTYNDQLRVYHDTDRSHHSEPALNAASISNLALLSYLRYPPSRWWLGMAQIVGRVRWLLAARRFRGLLRGIAEIPTQLWRYRRYRRPVSTATVDRYRRMARG